MLFYGSVYVYIPCIHIYFHSDTTCMNGTVRLVGGLNVKQGRVHICYDGQWHSICSDNWNEMNAESDVVCSTLGYSSDLGKKQLKRVVLQEKPSPTFTAVSVTADFGNDSSPVFPNDIQCIGDELTLNNCIFTEHNHRNCQKIAGVICEGMLNCKL